MNQFSGMTPNLVLAAVLAGLLTIVALSAATGVLADVVRWFVGDDKDDPYTESPRPVIKSLKGRGLTILAIALLAGGGATALANQVGKAGGNAPSSSISNEGKTGWVAPGNTSGGTTLGEAISKANENTPSGKLAGEARRDAQNAVNNSGEAANAIQRGDASGAVSAGTAAYADLISSVFKGSVSKANPFTFATGGIPALVGGGFVGAVKDYLVGIKDQIESRSK